MLFYSFDTSFLSPCLQIATTRVGHIALKSASPQVLKLFFVAPQRILRFSKAKLRSLRLKILDAT
jgi:hypothetical protein